VIDPPAVEQGASRSRRSRDLRVTASWSATRAGVRRPPRNRWRPVTT